MSPTEIEVLLHCYRVMPTPHPRKKLPEIKNAILKLLDANLIYLKAGEDDLFETTDGGKLLVETLCAVPIPIQKRIWVMPESKS